MNDTAKKKDMPLNSGRRRLVDPCAVIFVQRLQSCGPEADFSEVDTEDPVTKGIQSGHRRLKSNALRRRQKAAKEKKAEEARERREAEEARERREAEEARE